MSIVEMTDARLKRWRKAIKDEAEKVFERPFGAHVYVTAIFLLPRPKSVAVSKRPEPTVFPDIDKFARSLLDALTKVAWNDDAQVTDLHVSKLYAIASQPVGVQVTITGPEPEPLL